MRTTPPFRWRPTPSVRRRRHRHRLPPVSPDLQMISLLPTLPTDRPLSNQPLSEQQIQGLRKEACQPRRLATGLPPTFVDTSSQSQTERNTTHKEGRANLRLSKDVLP